MYRIKSIIAMLFATSVMALLWGCDGDQGPVGPPGAGVSNAKCLSSGCHGNPELKKTIVNDLGVEEYVPLYVDSAQFAATEHGIQLCVSCHSDINGDGAAHARVFKTYGGWSRFSRKQAVESIDPTGVVRTRNYVTAASFACITCHTDQSGHANSAHATIFKLRQAKVDHALTTIAGKEVGENYAAGDCNRCHATCATCHFKSTIRKAANGSAMTYWDDLQAHYPNVSGWNDKFTEFEMDWTSNVVSHNFRPASYFVMDVEGVCEACHTGYQKPAAMAYYWKDANHTVADSLIATDVKRHPQSYELKISGISSYQSGGDNVSHGARTCAGCHGGATGDIHSLPGLPYEWSAKGDVQCIDCHSASHTNGSVALHLDDNGVKVACIGCHTFGLARDFDPVSGGHDVFLDPETNEVRPVVYKHALAEAWYSHNWQTLNAGSGGQDPNSDCAKKCHYPGNKIGASGWAGVAGVTGAEVPEYRPDPAESGE